MRYYTVNQIKQAPETVEAISYLKQLWYAKEEEIFSFSLDYGTFTHQLMHLRASAPENWKLTWDGYVFSLSRKTANHGVFTIMSLKTGQLAYIFS